MALRSVCGMVGGNASEIIDSIAMANNCFYTQSDEYVNLKREMTCL